MDVRTITKAVSRSASKAWRRSWPDGLFRRIMGSHALKLVVLASRDDAVNVHQLRAGHWTRSTSYLHRIARRRAPVSSAVRDQMPGGAKPGGREDPDTPEHVLLECPCLAGVRLRFLGNIRQDPMQLRGGGAVAASGHGYPRHQEPLGYGRRS